MRLNCTKGDGTNEYPRTDRTVRVVIEVIPEERKLMRRLLLGGALLAMLTGCSETANSESDVTIKVLSGGVGSPSPYFVEYEMEDIEDYTTNKGKITINFKDGSQLETSMYSIKTK